MENSILFFLKFGKSKHLKSLQKGNVYMKNLRFFNELEKIENNKGKGDINEGKMIIKEVDFIIKDNEDNTKKISGYSPSITISSKADEEIPIFCMSYIDMDNIKIKEENEEMIKGKLVFTDEQKEEFIKNFGEAVLIISPNQFLKRIKKEFEKKGIISRAGIVKYSNYNKNYKQRMMSYINDDSSMFFWKDSLFKNQKEYRIALLSEKVEKDYQINIGSLEDISKLISAKELFEQDIEITIKRHQKSS